MTIEEEMKKWREINTRFMKLAERNLIDLAKSFNTTKGKEREWQTQQKVGQP